MIEAKSSITVNVKAINDSVYKLTELLVKLEKRLDILEGKIDELNRML